MNFVMCFANPFGSWSGLEWTSKLLYILYIDNVYSILIIKFLLTNTTELRKQVIKTLGTIKCVPAFSKDY